ncbi:polyphenol oxidase family protein [Bifidobacterium sp. ESL0790]|uniref:polyphenol oxidase family protein n=1 Tax=Bifidobacterium sp. ESL0790 TaxID=2983233 RepID=UPI0023F80531|nr:polyphenol oxidase family protein [Bifidobacterium sp. ESL0790]WEV72706.1 polyphenol oxidase family protein [Bifidobacterium sp. ESL0790]
MNESKSNDQRRDAYDDAILDSNAIAPNDAQGNPIPVTIPIDLAPGVKVVYTTRLGGVSEGDWADCNFGGKSGDNPVHVRANREALAKAIDAPLSLVGQVHSGRAIDVDECLRRNASYGSDLSGTVMDQTQSEALQTPVVTEKVEETKEIISDEGVVVREDSTVIKQVADDAGTDGGQLGTSEDLHDSVPAEPGHFPKLEADGQVTTQTGMALGMFAADCLPVLLADATAGVIGACHCGRRGLERGVIGSTVELMLAKGARPERIVATLGPCICGDCYEVGDEIADAFDARFPGTFTLTRFGGPGIDIAKAARQELEKAGIPRDNVIDSAPRVAAATQYLDHDAELADLCANDGEGESDLADRLAQLRHPMCTLENPLWYSHRRASLAKKEHEGRFLALIVRED